MDVHLGEGEADAGGGELGVNAAHNGVVEGPVVGCAGSCADGQVDAAVGEGGDGDGRIGHRVLGEGAYGGFGLALVLKEPAAMGAEKPFYPRFARSLSVGGRR